MNFHILDHLEFHKRFANDVNQDRGHMTLQYMFFKTFKKVR